MVDFYKILNVPRDADTETIKRAYRRLALECHPDRRPDSEQAGVRFRAATEAYRVLLSAERRAAYDLRNGWGFDADGAAPALDLFEALEIFARDFGPVAHAEGAPMPGDTGVAEIPLTVSLREAFSGGQLEVRLPCCSCAGSGGQGGAAATVLCTGCGGSGQQRRWSEPARGGPAFTTARCDDCAGTGRRVLRPCRVCGGRGHDPAASAVTVQVPAGVVSGDRIRIQPGDATSGVNETVVHVVVHVAEVEPPFQRCGSDVLVDVAITYPQAVLGADIDVPTLAGTERVRVAPGTPSGHLLRLPGLGLPDRGRSGSGDQLVRLQIAVASEPGTEELRLLRRLDRIASDRLRGAATPVSTGRKWAAWLEAAEAAVRGWREGAAARGAAAASRRLAARFAACPTVPSRSTGAAGRDLAADPRDDSGVERAQRQLAADLAELGPLARLAEQRLALISGVVSHAGATRAGLRVFLVLAATASFLVGLNIWFLRLAGLDTITVPTYAPPPRWMGNGSLVPILLSLLPIVLGVALRGLESEGKGSLRMALLRAGPNLFILGLAALHGFAYAVIGAQIGLAARLGLFKGDMAYPVVQYSPIFLGFVMPLLLATLGYVLWMSGERYLTFLSRLAAEKQLRDNTRAFEGADRRLAGLAERLETFRDSASSSESSVVRGVADREGCGARLGSPRSRGAVNGRGRGLPFEPG